jgi:hypothetical protein
LKNTSKSKILPENLQKNPDVLVGSWKTNFWNYSYPSCKFIEEIFIFSHQLCSNYFGVLIGIEKYWEIIIIRGRILKNAKEKTFIFSHLPIIYWCIIKYWKIFKKYWRVSISILINIKCIEGCSPNSTKISSIYCRTYFLNILSSNFSEGCLRNYTYSVRCAWL